MSYWWHAAAASTAAGAGIAVATPTTVAAIAATPSPTKKGSAQAPLEAPTALLITNLAETELTLDWPPVIGATKYDIERNGFIIVINWTFTSYNDTGLTPSTTYRYRVMAKP